MMNMQTRSQKVWDQRWKITEMRREFYAEHPHVTPSAKEKKMAEQLQNAVKECLFRSNFVIEFRKLLHTRCQTLARENHRMTPLQSLYKKNKAPSVKALRRALKKCRKIRALRRIPRPLRPYHIVQIAQLEEAISLLVGTYHAACAWTVHAEKCYVKLHELFDDTVFRSIFGDSDAESFTGFCGDDEPVQAPPQLPDNNVINLVSSNDEDDSDWENE